MLKHIIFVLCEQWFPHPFSKDIVINQAGLRWGVTAPNELPDLPYLTCTEFSAFPHTSISLTGDFHLCERTIRCIDIQISFKPCNVIITGKIVSLHLRVIAATDPIMFCKAELVLQKY